MKPLTVKYDINLTNGQQIEIMGQPVTLQTEYTQADLSTETDRNQLLSHCASIDEWYNQNSYNTRGALFDDNTQTLIMEAMPDYTNTLLTDPDYDVYAYMVLNDNKIHRIKLGELSPIQHAAGLRLELSAGQLDRLIMEDEY